jgi:cardiolipin synthase C
MFRRLICILFFPVFSLVEANSVVQLRQMYHQNPPDTAVIYSLLNLPSHDLKKKTGVYTLEVGGESLATRLWLIANSKRSLDIQYYSFARNITGILFCTYLVNAADRGVKVRLLVDEAANRMNAYEIKVLDAHENIEIRVYNAGLKLGRADRKLKQLYDNRNRLLRRMHNKTMVIDGQAAITGGRNVSDEYFDFDGRYNFRDRDVLLLGEAVATAGESFRLFWDDRRTVSVEQLYGKSRKPFDFRELFDKLNSKVNDTTAYGPAIREHISSFPAKIAKARRSGGFFMVDAVSFVSDVPGKNEDKKERLGGICTDTIIALIRSARHTLDIQSPYLITTDEVKQLLRETVQRGVKVRILTNSLASTDNLEAFSGYQRDRKGNLATGVEIYEFRPDPAVRFSLSIPDLQSELHYKPVYGLHSKTMIVDGRTSVIGSYNLDPRSANYNTECVAVIRSESVAKNLALYLEEEFLPRNAWRITPAFNPDKEASLRKRFKAFTRRVLPKKLL